MNRAQLYMILAAISFAGMGALLKLVADQLPTVQLIFFRAFISAVLIALLMWRQQIAIRGNHYPLLIARGITGLLAMMCNFYALGRLALGDVSILVHAYPIFAALLAFLVLRERLDARIIGWIVVSWIGIVLILRPQFQFVNYAGLIALLGAVLIAVNAVIIRYSHATDPSLRIAWYCMAICAFCTLPFMPTHFVMPSPHGCLYLLGAGIMGTGGQVFMTASYGLDEVSRLAPLSYVGVLCAFGLDLWLWEAIPTSWTIAGTALVMLSCLMIVRRRGPTAVINRM